MYSLYEIYWYIEWKKVKSSCSSPLFRHDVLSTISLEVCRGSLDAPQDTAAANLPKIESCSWTCNFSRAQVKHRSQGFFSLKYRIWKKELSSFISILFFLLSLCFPTSFFVVDSDSRPVVFFAALFGTHHFEPPSSQGLWHTRNHQTNQYKPIQTRYSTRISRKHIPAFSGWLLECGVLWYFGVWEGTWEDCVWRKTSIQMCSGHLGPGSETSYWYLCLEIQNIQCCDAFEHLRSQQLHMSRIPMSINT